MSAAHWGMFALSLASVELGTVSKWHAVCLRIPLVFLFNNTVLMTNGKHIQ